MRRTQFRGRHAAAIAVVPLAMVASLAPGSATPATSSTRQTSGAHVPSFLKAPAASHGRLAKPTPGKLKLVGLRTSLLPRHASGQQISFGRLGGERMIGTFTHKEKGPHFTAWSGTTNTRFGTFQVARSGSVVRVAISDTHGSWEITKAGAGAYWLASPPAPHKTGDDERVAPSTTASTAGADRQAAAQRSDATSTAMKGLPSGPSARADAGVIDVLFVYTATAASQGGGVNGINAYVGTAAAQTNQALTNSQVPLQVRVVGIVGTPQADSGDISTELNQVAKPGDGAFDEVPGERDAYHADLVHLLIGGSSPTYCGLGYLNQPNEDDSVYGYSSSYISNCAVNHTITHELGHNFGADHDNYPGVSHYSTLPFAYGWKNVQQGWVTIMSYPNQIVDQNPNACCKYPLFYSNPNLAYGGVPLGTSTAFNAQAIAQIGPEVVQYRQSQIYAGSVLMSGKAKVGHRLSGQPSGWLPGGLSYSYQWFRDGTAIPGKNSASLKMRAGYAGHYIQLVVYGFGGTYQATGNGGPIYKVRKGTFKRTSRPHLAGRHTVGHKLKVRLGKFRPKPQKVKYVWFRNHHKIKHHHGKTYRLKRKDAGKKIFVKVTVRHHGYHAVHKKTRKVRIHHR